MTLRRSHPSLARAALAAAVLLTAGLSLPRPALAQDTQRAQSQPDGNGVVTQGLNDQGRVRLDAGRTTILQTGAPVTEISVGTPEVAEINLLSPTRILVTGRGPGTTQIVMFAGDASQVIEVDVEADISGLRSQLADLFPAVPLSVQESKGRLVLRGDVPNLEVSEQIIQVAAPYGEVLNFLEVSGGQQIMLQVIFEEVSRSASTQLGFNFGVTGQDGFGASNIGGRSMIFSASRACSTRPRKKCSACPRAVSRAARGS